MSNYLNFPKKNQQGYIALTSVIIISILLITISTALSSVNYYSRFNILESEFKQRSLSLAESCVDQALINIVQGVSTLPNAQVTWNGSNCTINSSTDSGANKIIKTQGMFQNSYTNLEVVVKVSDLSLVSWQELAN